MQRHNQSFACTPFKCEPVLSETSIGYYQVLLFQSKPGGNGNEGTLCIPQSVSITGSSPLDCSVSYPGDLLWSGVLPLMQRYCWCILQPQGTGLCSTGVESVVQWLTCCFVMNLFSSYIIIFTFGLIPLKRHKTSYPFMGWIVPLLYQPSRLCL